MRSFHDQHRSLGRGRGRLPTWTPQQSGIRGGPAHLLNREGDRPASTGISARPSYPQHDSVAGLRENGGATSAMMMGRGRGVSNQPAWLQQRNSQDSISSNKDRTVLQNRDQQGDNNSASSSRQFRQQEQRNRDYASSRPHTNGPAIESTKARDEEHNSVLVTTAMQHEDEITPLPQQQIENDEDDVPLEDLEKVAEQYIKNLEEDDDITEQIIRRQREERKRRMQQELSQREHEADKIIHVSTSHEGDASPAKKLARPCSFHSATRAESTVSEQSNDNPQTQEKNEIIRKQHSIGSSTTSVDPQGNDNNDDDDDLFDMFATDTTVEKLHPSTFHHNKQPLHTTVAPTTTADAANYDDSEGYYRATIGEYMGPLGQYRVLGNTGKGVFSTVIKCADISVEEEDGIETNNSQPQHRRHKVVAIKLIRNNETMAKAAVKELRILRMLKSNTNTNTFCVELLDKFEHLNHTTFVFEYLDMNLRETLYKFGRNVGIAIAAIRTYTKQLLCALQHLSRHGVVHADIKPDNILVSANYGMVKLCDFGSAFLESEYMDTDPTPYLVSRFYRPPEVILGLEYDKSIDLWSLAVTLAELFTGSVLFPGNTNNDMLQRFMDCLGPFSNKMLRRHFLSYQKLQLQPHFDPEDYRFKMQTFDKVTGKPVIQHLHMNELLSSSSKKQLVHVLLKAKSASDDRGSVLKFSDLLVRCLALDPHKRVSIQDALSHDFISPATKKKTSDKAPEQPPII